MPACLVRIVVSSHSHPVTTHEMYECTMSRAWTSAQRTLMEKRRLFRRQQQCSRIIYVEYMCFGKSTTQNGIRTGNERIALARKLYPHTSDAFKCFRISVSRNGTISSQTARARLGWGDLVRVMEDSAYCMNCDGTTGSAWRTLWLHRYASCEINSAR